MGADSPDRYAHCVQIPALTAIAVGCGPRVIKPMKPAAYPSVIVALLLESLRSSLKKDVTIANANNPASDSGSTLSVSEAKPATSNAPVTITAFV